MVYLLVALSAVSQPGEPDLTKVTSEQKKGFLELIKKLPVQGEFFTAEGVKMASPYLHVLLALDEKDINEDHYYAVLALSSGLHESAKQHRQFAAKHFAKIAHPAIKLGWGIMLFRFSDEVTPEIVRYLRESLDDRQRSEMFREMVGPEAETVRKEIISKAGKQK